MKMRKTILLLVCLATALPVSAENWQSADSSEFTFTAVFEGEPLPGSFTEFDVELTLRPTAIETSSLRVTVALGAADMGDPDMNAVLFDPAWFDVEQFAAATYSSNTIVAKEDGSYAATGLLNLKGTEAPVTVPFTWQRSGPRATMQGSFSIRRTDFGVGDGEWSTDDSISLEVECEFIVRLELQD